MNRFSESKRSGYVTLLAVTFAFGLATLGTALAVSARSYIESAALRERAILDRISLESTAARTLAEIAASGTRPLKSVQLEAVQINSRSLVAELAIPEIKVDLGMDDEKAIRKAVPSVPAATSVDQAAMPQGLAQWARAAGYSAPAEDCLRRSATFGRAPEPYGESLGAEGAHQESRLAVGDQVDLRVHFERRKMSRVLWIRARYVGGDAGWRIHDYRQLVGHLSQACFVPPIGK